MAYDAGEIRYKVGTDNKGLDKGLSSAMGSIKGFVAKAGIIAGVFSFIKKGFQQASDYAENWSIVANSAGQEVQDSFQKAFKNLRRVSKSEAAALAATITGTMKSKGIGEDVIASMGPQILQRLEDTGAFFNKTTEEVESAFTSMISGMSRPMEMLTRGAVVPLVQNLDILANQQYGMDFEKLAPDEQTLLRMQFFLEGTSKIPFLVGNSAKTIGTFKGQLDAMKKSIADSSSTVVSSLIPVAEKLMSALAGVAKWVSKNIGLIGAFATAFAAVKFTKFLIGMGKVIMSLYTAAVAKAGMEGGIFGVISAGAVATGLAAILGGIAGGMFFSGGGGSATGSSTPKQENTNVEVAVTFNPDGIESATSNGINTNVQGNVGKGTL